MTPTHRDRRVLGVSLFVLMASAASQVLVGRLDLEAEWPQASAAGTPLDHPMGIAINPAGEILVADSGNARLVVYAPGGDARAVWPLPDGARPVGLAARHDGSVLVADYLGDQVLVLGTSGELLERWGRTGTAPGEFQAPSGIAVGPGGRVAVVEFMGQRVQVLDHRGRFVRFVGIGDATRRHVMHRARAPGMETMAMPDGPRAGDPYGLFSFPSDAAFAADGTLYVSNTHAYEILVFDADGTLRDAWGRKGAAAGEWEVPVGLAVDAAGNLFVADSANFRVQGLGPTGAVFLVSRADERWYRTTRRIYSPTDLVLDSGGRLYVVDFAASRIQRFHIIG